MDRSRQFFLYCERGADPAFWAEPFNALSNAAFVLAAFAAAMQLHARTRAQDKRWREWALIVIAGLIGLGSFLFHTFATRWALIADTSSIFLFAFAYLTFALRRFLAASWPVAVLALALLFTGFAGARALPCPAGLLPVTAAAGHPCLNGTHGYFPVIAAMGLVALVLAARGHAAAWLVGAAAAVFAASLFMRTVDVEVCVWTQMLGRQRGTHALWHIFNGLAVYLLLVAAIRHGLPPRLLPTRG